MKTKTFRISVEIDAPVYEGTGDFPPEVFAIEILDEQFKMALSKRFSFLMKAETPGSPMNTAHFKEYQERHIASIEKMQATMKVVT